MTSHLLKITSISGLDQIQEGRGGTPTSVYEFVSRVLPRVSCLLCEKQVLAWVLARLFSLLSLPDLLVAEHAMSIPAVDCHRAQCLDKQMFMHFLWPI